MRCGNGGLPQRRWRRDLDERRALGRAARGMLDVIGVDPGRAGGAADRLHSVCSLLTASGPAAALVFAEDDFLDPLSAKGVVDGQGT